MESTTSSRPAPSTTILLWISETVLLFLCYVTGAVLAIGDSSELYLLYENGFVHIAVLVLVIQIGLWLEMLYGPQKQESRTHLVLSLLEAQGAAFLVQAIWSVADASARVPALVMLYGGGFTMLVIPLWRWVFARLVPQAGRNWRLLLVGSSPVLRELASQAPQAQLAIVSVLDPSRETWRSLLDRLPQIVEEKHPTHIVVASNPTDTREFLNLQWSGLQVVDATEFYEDNLRRVPASDLDPYKVLFTPLHPGRGPWAPLVACLLVVLSAPFWLILSLLLSSGPVWDRTLCQGYRGSPFLRYRFRIPRRKASGSEGPQPPTALGRWMWRWGIHRWPELLNVVRGEMDFVGPRPVSPAIAATLEQHLPVYRCRGSLRPGIFGWAQLNLFPSHVPELANYPPIDPIEEICYDLYYIKHQNMLLDLYILGHGLPTLQESPA